MRGPVLAALAATLLALTAQAQDVRPRRGGEPGDFDFYVLALSWSPGFCALEGDRRGLDQCEQGRGLGFVVHGLWPQFERGYPGDCGSVERPPSRAAIAEADGLFPSEGLARSEWRKHGTCSGLSPSAYFSAVRRARERVQVPESLRRPADDARLQPIEIERAFVAVNPGLRADMLSVVCRGRLLQEVRVCFTRDLRDFRACPEVDRSGCRGGGEIVVKAAR